MSSYKSTESSENNLWSIIKAVYMLIRFAIQTVWTTVFFKHCLFIPPDTLACLISAICPPSRGIRLAIPINISTFHEHCQVHFLVSIDDRVLPSATNHWNTADAKWQLFLLYKRNEVNQKLLIVCSQSEVAMKVQSLKLTVLNTPLLRWLIYLQ